MAVIEPYDIRARVLQAVRDERVRQDTLKAAGKFPFTCADTGLTQAEKLGVLAEEFGEVAQLVCRVMIPPPGDRGIPSIKPSALTDYIVKLHEELVQVAAVCVAWAESLEPSLPEKP